MGSSLTPWASRKQLLPTLRPLKLQPKKASKLEPNGFLISSFLGIRTVKEGLPQEYGGHLLAVIELLQVLRCKKRSVMRQPAVPKKLSATSFFFFLLEPVSSTTCKKPEEWIMQTYRGSPDKEGYDSDPPLNPIRWI